MSGFAGELYRTAHSVESITALQFFANLLAGGVISFFIAWLLYEYTERDTVSFIVGGLLSFKKVEDLIRIKNNILKHLLGEVKDE